MFTSAFKRRPLRRETKRLNQRKHSLRWELVHSAGCVHHDCAVYLAYRNPDSETDYSEDSGGRRVSVPRSLRPILGRWIGGTK